MNYEPERLQPLDYFSPESRDDGSTRFKVGDQVLWRRDKRKDMPGKVQQIRAGKVLVYFSGRGPWTGTPKWLEPEVLRNREGGCV